MPSYLPVTWDSAVSLINLNKFIRQSAISTINDWPVRALPLINCSVRRPTFEEIKQRGKRIVVRGAAAV